jgi:Mg2+ and Co2+ transporter CorA
MLFKEVNNTLNELYKSQENNASDRMNMLLFILTVFTVVSGIYGMNLVIKDWESPTGWKAFSSYTIFEWVSLITAVSGIVLSGLLIFSTVRKLVVNKIRKYRSDNHFE